MTVRRLPRLSMSRARHRFWSDQLSRRLASANAEDYGDGRLRVYGRGAYSRWARTSEPDLDGTQSVLSVAKG